MHTGAITDVNPFLVKLLGYSHAELLGKTLWEIGAPEDVEASKAAFLELTAKRFVRYENLPLLTKDGLSISVEVVSNVYRVNGDQVIQCNIRDIRQRKDAELSEQRLRQIQKMEAVGQLAGGVAHDFNNLLGVILGYCELLDEEIDLPEAAREMILEIHNAGTSAKNLTQRLLEFSHRQVLKPVVMDLNVTVRRTEKMLRRLISEEVDVVSILGNGLGRIIADPSQVELVLMNLAINARDAMPEGGTLRLAGENRVLDERSALSIEGARPGRWLVLQVEDTGTGIEPGVLAHIWEPFFTTKTADRGTGLGLSTVRGIVETHRGFITLATRPGHGTLVRIYLPVSEDKPGAETAQAAAPRGDGEFILVVDDEANIRDMVKTVLARHGYRVLSAVDGIEAISILAQQVGEIDLVVTDMVMPRLGGQGLIDVVRRLNPGVKVLGMSGGEQDMAVAEGTSPQAEAFLMKPFTSEALLTEIHRVLHPGKPPS